MPYQIIRLDYQGQSEHRDPLPLKAKLTAKLRVDPKSKPLSNYNHGIVLEQPRQAGLTLIRSFAQLQQEP